MKKTGNLFILSGPSGAGKTTLCSALLKRFPTLRYSVSYTTRNPRSGEQNGVAYYFIDEEEFKKGIETGRWAEWARVHGRFYGTSAEVIVNGLKEKSQILLDIDVQGTLQIIKRFPKSIPIFLMPPTMEALKVRLESRGTETEESVQERLINAKAEIARKGIYRHIVVNDHLERALDELSSIIEFYLRKEACRESAGA
ncbi:MAG: guanylate kinase [Deltaproteobacteria bacterium RBG_13_49_15]|nr:MAG: guanylate kinase [Deltaproteobacteria bacterium RBG_13_49_15]